MGEKEVSGSRDSGGVWGLPGWGRKCLALLLCSVRGVESGAYHVHFMGPAHGADLVNFTWSGPAMYPTLVISPSDDFSLRFWERPGIWGAWGGRGKVYLAHPCHALRISGWRCAGAFSDLLFFPILYRAPKSWR
ncbi:hypothetical protein BU16DRAFT_229364 [Lophium mytilinum]|uniref:Uncharacterized protein n=1 Tax=Lophium mytilinum TaxID=390894 RepID=A0A6A6Q734_9PEZI|nr:hypothetical protein BU16DRAFT_229364 [Lophium mytilinum]